MSKLLQKLQDHTRSGVYRTTRTDEIQDSVRGSDVRVAHVALSGPEAIYSAFASALGMSAFEGRGVTVEELLSSLPGEAHVLLIAHGAQHVAGLKDVLWGVARQRANLRQTSFFAVFIDPTRSMPLPDLFRGA
jgi:hypothetical protein